MLPVSYENLNASTPRSLASARFYEPYIDGDLLKVKTPSNLVDKLVLNDEPHIVENRFLGEHTFVYFKGRILLYHSEAYQKPNGDWIGFMSVGEIGEHSEKYTYLQKIYGEGDPEVPTGYSIHRSQVFVMGSTVYMVATIESGVGDSKIKLFKSTDGFNFTYVKQISNNANFGFTRYGHMWIVPNLVNGYYYAYYDGEAQGGVWIMKVARSTSIEGTWEYFADVTGAGTGGMRGGTCAIFHNNKFRVFYHYGSTGGNLPTELGYAEALASNPAQCSGHTHLLGRDKSPIGSATDQNGDQALLEINGSIWWGYQYAINDPILNGIFCYKKLNGLTYDKLFS